MHLFFRFQLSFSIKRQNQTVSLLLQSAFDVSEQLVVPRVPLKETLIEVQARRVAARHISAKVRDHIARKWCVQPGLVRLGSQHQDVLAQPYDIVHWNVQAVVRIVEDLTVLGIAAVLIEPMEQDGAQLSQLLGVKGL